jgi:hypothetical protein
MKKLVLLLVAASFLMLSCTSVAYKTIAVTENPVGTKIGKVDQTKGGTLEAAKNGGITRIGTVTQQLTQLWMSWLGGQKMILSEKYEIVVTGE